MNKIWRILIGMQESFCTNKFLNRRPRKKVNRTHLSVWEKCVKKKITENWTECYKYMICGGCAGWWGEVNYVFDICYLEFWTHERRVSLLPKAVLQIGRPVDGTNVRDKDLFVRRRFGELFPFFFCLWKKNWIVRISWPLLLVIVRCCKIQNPSTFGIFEQHLDDHHLSLSSIFGSHIRIAHIQPKHKQSHIVSASAFTYLYFHFIWARVYTHSYTQHTHTYVVCAVTLEYLRIVCMCHYYLAKPQTITNNLNHRKEKKKKKWTIPKRSYCMSMSISMNDMQSFEFCCSFCTCFVNRSW